MANRVQGEATILESEYDPDAKRRDGVDAQRDDGPVGLLADKLAGLPYEFLLDVRVAGRPDSQVRWRGRVPDKAEKLGFFDHIRIPVSLVVPVSVDPADPGRVEIDWAAFVALPDRVDRMKTAARRAQAAAVGATPAPDGMDEQDGATRHMVFRMAKQVSEGSLSRDQFELNCQQLMQVSQLSHADYLAAVAVADGR
jgi:hypothetical protein